MSRQDWIWQPHAGHFIGGRDCKFFLNTYVNGYIVSTVGEYFPDSRIREIYAMSRGVKVEGKGDSWDNDYLKKVGYEEIGCNRKYETMVFKAHRVDKSCCQYRVDSFDDIDFCGYNDAEEARIGHYSMCEKYDGEMIDE
jgi:hypothetical protein